MKNTLYGKGMKVKMKETGNTIFAGITFLLLMGLFFVKLTGPLIHIAIGLVMTMMMTVHFCRKRRCMHAVPEKMRLINGILLAALAGMLLSGILLHIFPEILMMKIIHKLSGAVFIIGIPGHILQHKMLRKEETKDVS